MFLKRNRTGGGLGKGCITGGCTGCLLVAAVVVAVPLVLLLAIGLVDRRDPQPESRRLVQALPPLGGPSASAEVVTLEAPEPAAGSERAARPEASGFEPLSLVLDLSKGSFTVEPGPADSELIIEADYDAATYELAAHFDPTIRRYEIRFDARGGWLRLLRSRSSDLNEVHITVPRGYPVLLTGKLSVGRSRVEIGGLAVVELDLDFGAGNHLLRVSEPLVRPAERIDVEGSWGELEVESLGNASPRRARLEHAGGSFRIDLQGAWQEDSDIQIECGFGDCHILRPEGVRTVLERATVSLGEKTLTGDPGQAEATGEEEGPTLHLWISSEAGDLRID